MISAARSLSNLLPESSSPTDKLLLLFLNTLISKERKEYIVSNLDRVDIQQSLGRGNKGEVDGMGWYPDG